jgi:hypothetical protein
MCGKGNLTLDNTSMIQHPSSIITVFDETNRTITKTYGVDETIEIKSTQGPSFWKMHKSKSYFKISISKSVFPLQ